MELIISILKFSRRLPISAQVAPPLHDFYVLLKTSRSRPLSRLLVLEDPLEYLRHKSMILSNGSFEISPFPNKFSMSKKFSLIPRSKMILSTSTPMSVYPILCTLYRSISMKYSRLSSSFCTILNSSSRLSLVLQYSWYFPRKKCFIYS